MSGNNDRNFIWTLMSTLTEEALLAIEVNESIREYLFLTFSGSQLTGYRFSKTAMLRMEQLSDVPLLINLEGVESAEELLKCKRETMAAFIYKHPWLRVDN